MMTPMKLSCIICAYNEAPRIGTVLTAVTNHPLIDETIVVNDASSDDTAQVVKKFPGVTLLDLPKNMGKSHALVQGFRLSQGELVMLLDADLANITAADITALAELVLSGTADVSLSLRKNAFAIHHLIGLDFTTGERVVPRTLLGEVLEEIEKLPKFGIESYMNDLIIKKGLRLAVVPWQRVTHTRKSEKHGVIRGTLADLSMTLDVLRVLSPLGIVRQNRALLKHRATR
jgi:glycosyltransferase involved in cell wall biosynthesis